MGGAAFIIAHSARTVKQWERAADRSLFGIIIHFPEKILAKKRQTVDKTAPVDFLTDDFAFEIVHKSTWHMNTILLFTEKE